MSVRFCFSSEFFNLSQNHHYHQSCKYTEVNGIFLFTRKSSSPLKTLSISSLHSIPKKVSRCWGCCCWDFISSFLSFISDSSPHPFQSKAKWVTQQQTNSSVARGSSSMRSFSFKFRSQSFTIFYEKEAEKRGVISLLGWRDLACWQRKCV